MESPVPNANTNLLIQALKFVLQVGPRSIKCIAQAATTAATATDL